MKTIKEIAAEIGVTKQAVFYRIKKPPLSNTLQPFISKLDGVLMVSFDGEKLIRQAFAEKVPSKEPSNEVSILDSVALRLLERENERLIAEIARLQSRNDELTAALIMATAKKRWVPRLPWKRER